MAARWDGDERGRGVGNAEELVSGAVELIAAFKEPDWVAEDPEAHLLPHVQAWCDQDRRLLLKSAYSDERTHAYVLDLGWAGAAGGVGQARAAVFALIGSFAESATYVRQRRVAGEHDGARHVLQFEVGTGELAPDARFAPHGHVVLINVVGVQG